MEKIYRTLVPVAFWLGIAAFVLALLMMLLGRQFLFALTPGGLVRGALALLFIAVAGYCAHRTTQRS